jgi:phage terminase small subunit
MKPKKLTAMQELFCKEYLVDLNFTAAAIRAGFSKRSAAQLGWQQMEKPQVKARVKELMDKRSNEVEINAEWVLRRLSYIADVDLKDAYDKDGQLLRLSEMPENLRRAVSSLDVYENFLDGVEVGETKKLRMFDKVRALEQIGRHLGMWNDSLNLNDKSKLTEEELDRRIKILKDAVK